MSRLGEVALIAIVVLVAPFAVYYIGGLIFWQGIYVSQENVVSAVEKQGYSEVVVNDKDVFFVSSWGGECGDKDDALFEITAINPVGNKVEIIACSGWPWKGVTIRTE